MSFARILLSAWLCACIAAGANAQDSVMLKFNTYRKSALQEKLFVHSDRDVYLTGETMWVKIYSVDAALHHTNDLSKVAYVEIVDKENRSLVNEKIALENGVGKGTLFIPASMESGTYLLRAYTAWMKNFSADSYFKKPVTVVNSFVKLEPTATSKPAPIYDAQLFPEGGNLLAGVTSRVGFKVTDQNGAGVDFSGSVVDVTGQKVVDFKPHRFGMGSFEIMPAAGGAYKAIIQVAGQSSPMEVALPVPLQEGFGLRVTETATSLNVEVSFIPAIQNGPAVYMLAHTRHVLVRGEKKRITAGKATFEINKKDLKAGITHITIFDENSRPVAERLYFKSPEEGLTLSVKSGQETYRTRNKVTLDVQTDRPVQQMSMSVYKLDSIAPAMGETHITDYLYLTSDLVGLVESPSYYFSGDADARLAADHLMLTQGWRRFTWNDVLRSKPSFTYAPEFHGHLIRAVAKEHNGTPASGVLAYVSVPGKIVDVYSARSDAKGEMIFEMKHFIGGQKVLTFTDSAHRVDLLSPFSEKATTARWPQLNLSTSVQRNLLARSVAMQVQRIYYDDTYITPRVDSTAFYGTADETYYLDDYTRFPVMEEVMREYVPGVLVRKQKDNFRFFLLDVVNKKPIYETPMILVDGVPVFDVNKIMSYDPLKVKKLEVVTRKFYHGMSTFPGIVSYSTYKGDLDGFELDSRYVHLDYEGLQQQREFYSPRHEYARETEARLPDQRTLLYWNDNLSTDETLKQNPQFFTSDVPGLYQVVVEGITKDGAAGFATQTFKVMK